jgi:hypothetical protein
LWTYTDAFLRFVLLWLVICRWPEDLAPGSVVLLSGKDDLMDAAEVKDMLDVAGHVKVSSAFASLAEFHDATEQLCTT